MCCQLIANWLKSKIICRQNFSPLRCKKRESKDARITINTEKTTFEDLILIILNFFVSLHDIS